MSILHDLNVERFDGALENGIRIVLLRRKGAPVATSAILNSGSRYDPADVPGTSHFIEHMIVNGSNEFPSKDVLAEHIESVGGSFGARTNQEFLIVDTEVSEKADYSRVVDIFNATLCKPLMDEKVFDNEKKIVIKEIQKSLSNPNQLQIKAARNFFFKDTVLEHEVLGDEQGILNLKYQEVLAMHEQLFDASRITFVVSGDIELDEVVGPLDMLRFKEGNDFERNVIARNAFPEEKIYATFFDTTQTHFMFGIPSPVSVSREMTQLNLLGAILAGGRSARLTKRLRYGKGLIYSISYARFGTSEIGQWVLTTDTSEDKVQEVMDEILIEIKELMSHGVTEAELEFVKNRKIKSMRRGMQTSRDWIDFYGVGEAFAPGKYRDIDAFIQEVQETTTKDIESIIANHFSSEKWQLAMVGRTKANDIKLNW